MITFELVTLSGIKHDEDVFEVVLPTPQGQIAVFPHHMPLVSLATPGIISVRKREQDPDDKMEHFATNGGVIEINGRRLRLLADEADHSSDVSEQEAQKALEEAKKQAHEAKDQITLDKANQIIQTQHARLKVAELRRKRRK